MAAGVTSSARIEDDPHRLDADHDRGGQHDEQQRVQQADRIAKRGCQRAVERDEDQLLVNGGQHGDARDRHDRTQHDVSGGHALQVPDQEARQIPLYVCLVLMITTPSAKAAAKKMPIAASSRMRPRRETIAMASAVSRPATSAPTKMLAPMM